MNEPPKHVLLIEDNPGDADLIRLRLIESKTPIEVNRVERLSDGLACLDHETPSVVLLDLNLPDCQGAETFRRVLAKAPDVPVVILSGQDDEGLAMKALHQGVQDYLVKSDFSHGELDRAMRHAVERQALLRSLEMSRKQQLEFKNQFLSHVSHELRTPLTCIHQFVTILLDGLAGTVSEEQREHLGTILRSVNQLNAMVRDLLEATRAEAGKIRLESCCLSILDPMRAAGAMLQATAREKRINLEVAADAGIPFVLGDTERILEVLINLIDNAIKFTPTDGSVIVRASRMRTDPEFVCITVSDTGPGITPESRHLIFERLYQSPHAADSSRKGLGLGLFIAKELVTLHGGRIWVTSEPGSGAAFSFTLPLYVLPKLLFPVVTHQNRLRDAFVLVRLDLRPRSKTSRGNWKETCSRSLDLLQRCVYLDKDLVLPPLAAPGPKRSYFVVASTDLERSEIMLTRIRGQMAKMPEHNAGSEFEVSARPIALPNLLEEKTLEAQVATVAERVTEMVRASLDPAQQAEAARAGSGKL
ncbi:MAG TPA: hybrid sensor histidine kinase/response regulator [Terriglobales bacterium]|nr:hybrid sensor histidine kinase/response regulator [Terriglobales bacterium]